jgi:hypothetical protein
MSNRSEVIQLGPDAVFVLDAIGFEIRAPDRRHLECRRLREHHDGGERC